MAKPVLISKLNFPSVIDVTNGTAPSVFSVELAPGALGAGATVQVSFDYIPFDFRLGETGKVNDTFTDSTPNYASSTLEFWRGWPAGEYTISKVYAWDDSGQVQSYNAAELAALGLPNHFTVINKLAALTPTENVNVGADGLLKGNVAQLSGTAGAGDSVKVTYKDETGATHTLGTAIADASGAWKLASEPLLDGVYSQVVAISTNAGGYASTYSQPVNFEVRGVPLSPIVHMSGGDYAQYPSKLPLLWGWATPNSTLKLYDNGKLIDTLTTDDSGWWGALLKTGSGQHAMTATVTTSQGMMISPASEALDVWVGPSPDGISFQVDSFKNETTQVFNQDKLTAALGAVSALFDGALAGTQKILFAVKISDSPAHENGYASATSLVQLAAEPGAMPSVTQAQLTLSSTFAKMINDAPSLTAASVTVLAHEMLHVLGLTESTLASSRKTIDGKDYFVGANAVVLNGGPVLLEADKAHIAESGHLLSADDGDLAFAFWGPSYIAPFTQLDLAMLKDLGYQNQQTLASRDGHGFILGSEYGIYGNDDSTAPDTLYVDGKVDDYRVSHLAQPPGGYDYDYALIKADSATLLGYVERLHFADGMIALDVGKGEVGGEVYRMYQAAFDRTPDSAGLGYWIAQMDHGQSLLSMASQFKNSAEFIARYGDNLGDSAFVNQLYHNVLHRAADQGGLDYWLGTLAAGASRESVLVQFSESPENVAQLTGTLLNGFGYASWVG